MTKDILYTDIYEGDAEKAKIHFPFLTNGLHLKVLSSVSTNIAVFPQTDHFYVVTYHTMGNDKFHVIIKETNDVTFLNIIIKRETYEAQWLDEEQFAKVKAFLNENNCQYI